MNIFEQATKQKLRFDSDRGVLSVEQLWDMPLSAKNGFDLDTLAKAVNRELKNTDEESFVKSSVSTVSKTLELKLEILKHIIAVKIEAADNAAKRAERAEKRKRLMSILEEKQDAELQGLTKEQILQQLNDLDKE